MKNRRTSLAVLSALAGATALALTACGGGDAPGAPQSSTPPTVSSPASSPSVVPSSLAPSTGSSADVAMPSDTAMATPSTGATDTAAPATSAPAASTPAPPVSGKTYGPQDKLPTVDPAKLPATIGDAKQAENSDSGGYAYVTYKDSRGATYSVTGPLGSAATTMAENIDGSKTPVGAGTCGTAMSKTNFVCYLQMEKGTLGVSLDGGWNLNDGSKPKLDDLIAFVKNLEASMG